MLPVEHFYGILWNRAYQFFRKLKAIIPYKNLQKMQKRLLLKEFYNDCNFSVKSFFAAFE